jgi:hypothetical protein
MFSFQTGKHIQCEVPGCKGFVANIRRHIRLCHPDIQQDLQVKSKREYERKECPKCGVVTTRLNLHLQRIHGVAKGEQLLATCFRYFQKGGHPGDGGPDPLSFGLQVSDVSTYSINI